LVRHRPAIIGLLLLLHVVVVHLMDDDVTGEDGSVNERI
jgi:hypothetical protein